MPVHQKKISLILQQFKNNDDDYKNRIMAIKRTIKFSLVSVHKFPLNIVG